MAIKNKFGLEDIFVWHNNGGGSQIVGRYKGRSAGFTFGDLPEGAFLDEGDSDIYRSHNTRFKDDKMAHKVLRQILHGKFGDPREAFE